MPYSYHNVIPDPIRSEVLERLQTIEEKENVLIFLLDSQKTISENNNYPQTDSSILRCKHDFIAQLIY